MVAGTDATVVDFWRFTLSTLRMNNARGYLDEFLATRAIGLAGLRVKWDSYNALTLNGATIGVEVSRPIHGVYVNMSPRTAVMVPRKISSGLL